MPTYQTYPPPRSYSDPKGWTQLAEPLRSCLYQAHVDCMLEHPTWIPLGLNSGKRTDWMQYLLRTPDRGIPAGHQYDPRYKGNPLTALPGRSNHRNLSRDISAADLYRGLALDWLHAHQKDYGINFPMSSEYWHAEVNGYPTRRITPYDQHFNHEEIPDMAITKAEFQQMIDTAINRAIGQIWGDEASDIKESKRISAQVGKVNAYSMAAFEASNPGASWVSLKPRAAEIDKQDKTFEI